MVFKRGVYIGAFIVLGVLLQQLVHAGLEVVVIRLLVSDFERYGLGLSWEAWYVVHAVGSIVLLIGGIAFGWWQGLYWWPRMYRHSANNISAVKRKKRWGRSK